MLAQHTFKPAGTRNIPPRAPHPNPERRGLHTRDLGRLGVSGGKEGAYKASEAFRELAGLCCFLSFSLRPLLLERFRFAVTQILWYFCSVNTGTLYTTLLYILQRIFLNFVVSIGLAALRIEAGVQKIVVLFLSWTQCVRCISKFPMTEEWALNNHTGAHT